MGLHYGTEITPQTEAKS